jgi:hypothetical protein
MISVAIVCIAFTLSLDQIFALNKLHHTIDAQNQSRMDAKLIADYLANNLRQIGGGFVRPWMAMVLENNCAARDGMPACNGADRLTYAHLNRDFATCAVTSADNGNRLHFDPAATQCCSADIDGKQLILGNGAFYSSFYATNPVYDAPTSKCYIDVISGQLYGMNAANGPGAWAGWNGAQMAVVDATTIYIDPVKHEMYTYVDKNNNRTIDADEEMLVADQVVDLQFLQGFDRIPQDGSVENLNSDQDEWLYNSVSANEKLGQAGLSTAALTDMRMIALGVITEAKFYGKTSESRLFDGPLRKIDNSQLTTGQSRIYLRSTFIYNN